MPMKEESKTQHQRATWHDYSPPGFYMLTLVTEGRQPAFGRLVGESAADAHIELTALGRALVEEILSQPRRHAGLEVVAYVVMEDHCHICLRVGTELRTHLGKVVWGVKYGSTEAYLNLLNQARGGTHRVENARPSAAQRGGRQRGGRQSGSTALNTAAGAWGVLNMAAGSPVGGGVSAGDGAEDVRYVAPLWQAGYHDRIVTRVGQIARIKGYIRSNPSRLWLKRHAPREYARVRDIEHPIPLPMAQALKNFALYWDERRSVHRSDALHRADGAYYATSYVQLVQKFLWKRQALALSVPSAPSAPVETYLRLRACGGLHLLHCGRPLVRVRISRSISTEALVAEKERLLLLCESEGAVLISPFISAGEKAVRDAALAAGYPLIILHGEEMSPLWKPTENLQEACYRGDILFLAPWYDRPRGQRPQKPDMEMLNELCRQMSLADGGERPAEKLLP